MVRARGRGWHSASNEVMDDLAVESNAPKLPGVTQQQIDAAMAKLLRIILSQAQQPTLHSELRSRAVSSSENESRLVFYVQFLRI